VLSYNLPLASRSKKPRNPVRAPGSSTGARARAGETVRDWHQRFDAVVRAAGDAILVIDHDGAVEVFNPAAERMFGYQAEQVLGGPATMLAPVPYRNALDTFLRSHLVGGAGAAAGAAREAQGLRSDGRKFPIQVSVGFVGSGDRPELVAVIRDLTEARAVLAELE
jgi:PAS domain S-box-containing protein